MVKSRIRTWLSEHPRVLNALLVAMAWSFTATDLVGKNGVSVAKGP